jgi:hypothetical protein
MISICESLSLFRNSVANVLPKLAKTHTNIDTKANQANQIAAVSIRRNIVKPNPNFSRGRRKFKY